MVKASTESTRQFTTHNTLPANLRAQSIELLNQSLAALFDLQSQTKQAHWNVKGDQFYGLHLLFDEIAEELSGFVDEVAERVVALGGYATGTARMAAKDSFLPEFPVAATTSLEHVQALVERFGLMSKHLREAIGWTTDDAGTADLYTGISRTVDKRLWFLEAHIQKSA